MKDRGIFYYSNCGKRIFETVSERDENKSLSLSRCQIFFCCYLIAFFISFQIIKESENEKREKNTFFCEKNSIAIA